jgi:hypothetical protein
VGGYVIIDDHVDMGELRSHLVRTQPAHGLQPADAPRAIAMLRRPISFKVESRTERRRWAGSSILRRNRLAGVRPQADQGQAEAS